MNNHNGATPLFGQKPRIGTNMSAFIRSLDADGKFEADGLVQVGPGQAVPIVNRERYLDANELLQEIRQIVREELAAVIRAAQVVPSDTVFTYQGRTVTREQTAAALAQYFKASPPPADALQDFR